MPEMPEVEHIKQMINREVKNREVEGIEVLYAGVIKRPTDPNQFIHSLVGQTLHHVDRRGKYLLFHFEESVLVSHLRMTGSYYVHQSTDSLANYAAVIFQFSNDRQLRYHDLRKLGTMEIYGKNEPIVPIERLGIEPLSEGFTVALLEELGMKSNRSIKSFLLDQRKVAGIGNIYADEICYKARINPGRKTLDITEIEWEHLYTTIMLVLKDAIAFGGGYTFFEKHGHYPFSLYQRAGSLCEQCGTEIERVVVTMRGTYYCPTCQK
ncbi:hypothetical protein DH09_12525 [Bacillaceae bacterium JMAK1]|nr:hypothetical protein DH09_12525 [Bacillaceae bacterium JMAK1]